MRLHAGTTKNREGRVFPFGHHPDLLELLKALKVDHDALKETGTIVPWVFTRGSERIAGFRKAWGTACKNAGCPGRIPHDLRRTAGPNLVRAGISERVATQLTGHKTRSVFERYNIVSNSDLRDAVRRLAQSR